MVHTNVLNRTGGRGVRSSADALKKPIPIGSSGFRQLRSPSPRRSGETQRLELR